MTTEHNTLGGSATAVAPGSPTHWCMRIGDGKHFKSSQSFLRWGINSDHPWNKSFIKRARAGDILWFIQGGNRGKAIGVATFTYQCERVIGPLIAVTPTNEELGWTKDEGTWDVEVHYTNLYDLTECDVYTEIKSPLTVRTFNRDKCSVDLEKIYPYILQFSKATIVRSSN